jgi:hypothetical protein
MCQQNGFLIRCWRYVPSSNRGYDRRRYKVCREFWVIFVPQCLLLAVVAKIHTVLSLDIGRVAEISAITWEPTADNDHLVLIDDIGTAASMWVRSGAVVRGERLYPCERRYG